MNQHTKPHPDSQAIGAAIRHARKTLCARVDAAAAEPDAGFAHAFAPLVAAVERVFRHEEGALEILGYTQLREHREENAMILAALHRVLVQVEVGECGLGRQVLAALRDVLGLHRLNTDLALATAPPPSHEHVHGKAARATLHVPPHLRRR